MAHTAAQTAAGAASVGGGGEASLERLAALVGGLVFPPSAAADAGELGRCLAAARGVRAWADAYEAEALAVAARTDAASESGAADLAAWLRAHTGITRREALARTRTADGIDGLPGVRRALSEGRISHGHAQAIARLASPDGIDMNVAADVDFPSRERTIADAARAHLDELLAAAASMPLDAYWRFLRRFADLAAGDDGAERDRRHYRNRRLTTSEDHDGMGIFRAALPPELFTEVENELRRIAEARWRAEHPDADGISAKDLTCPQRNADAIVEMARRSRKLADDRREPLGNHIDVMVLIDAQTLESGLHENSRCELDDGRPISPVAARRLLCDANIITALWDKTKFKLDLGYDARCATRNIRRALIARDRTCTAPGCDRPHWMCQIHHIIPWSQGGPTNLDNLTLLCHKHHHQHHANERTGVPPTPNAAGTFARNAAQAPWPSQPTPPAPNAAGGAPQNGAGAPRTGRTAPPAPNGTGGAPQHGAGAPRTGRTAAPGPMPGTAANGNGAGGTGAGPPANGTEPVKPSYSTSATRSRTAQPRNASARPPGDGAESAHYGTGRSRAGRAAPPGSTRGTGTPSNTGAPSNRAVPPRKGAVDPSADRRTPPQPKSATEPSAHEAAPPGDGDGASGAGRRAPPDPEPVTDAPGDGTGALGDGTDALGDGTGVLSDGTGALLMDRAGPHDVAPAAIRPPPTESTSPLSDSPQHKRPAGRQNGRHRAPAARGGAAANTKKETQAQRSLRRQGRAI